MGHNALQRRSLQSFGGFVFVIIQSELGKSVIMLALGMGYVQDNGEDTCTQAV
jgi:hypothetical protein